MLKISQELCTNVEHVKEFHKIILLLLVDIINNIGLILFQEKIKMLLIFRQFCHVHSKLENSLLIL